MSYKERGAQFIVWLIVFGLSIAAMLLSDIQRGVKFSPLQIIIQIIGAISLMASIASGLAFFFLHED